MSDSAEPKFSWLAWAQLVRLPTVFTILADVGAAFLLVAHGPHPLSRFLCVLLAGVALYWAGMILNDVFDIEKDRRERSGRPLPAGLVSTHTAVVAGWGLLVFGIVASAVSGFLPGSFRGEVAPLPSTWLPGAIALVLAVMIVAYDGPLKSTVLAPYAMGSCRFLSFLLGASPCLVAGDWAGGGGALIPKYVMVIASGFGIYIAGITTIARNEAVGGYSTALRTGMLLIIIGTIILAFAPQAAGRDVGWRLSPRGMFSGLDRVDRFSGHRAWFAAVRQPVAGQYPEHDSRWLVDDDPFGGFVCLVGCRPSLGTRGVCVDRSGDFGCDANAGDVMQIGFHASSLLLHDEVTLVGELAAMGYQSIVVRPRCGRLAPADELFPQVVQQLRRAIEQHEMTLLIDTAGAFLHDPHQHDGPSLAAENQTESQQAEEWIERWIDLADEITATTVTFRSGFANRSSPRGSESDETILNRLAERLNRLTERSAAAGVRLAMRPASGEAISTVAQFERMVQWVEQNDRLYLAADVAEMLKEGEFPVADRLERNLSRLACVFLCEYGADRWRNQIPTHCEIDMRRITASLRRMRFSGAAIARIEGHSEKGLSLAQDALEWFDVARGHA